MTDSSSYRIASVLAAGGKGERFGLSGNKTAKQFIELKGYPIYVWSLLSLIAHPQMKDVVVVCPSTEVDAVKEQITKLLVSKKTGAKIHVTAGGGSRQESVFLGLQHLDKLSLKPDYVLIHDAARPFIDLDMVDRVIKSVIEYGACTVAIPASDTIKRINEGLIVDTLDRSQILMAQTPQAASFEIMLRGHQEAAANGIATTDDAAIVERCGLPVRAIAGNPYNIKITQHLDLIMIESLAGTLLKDRL